MVGWSATVAAEPSEPSPLAPPLLITTTVLPRAQIGSPYSVTLTTTGGTGPFTWSLADGTHLPGGLSLDAATGTIAGTPAASDTPGTYDFTVEATGTGPTITVPPVEEFKDLGPFQGLDGFFTYVLHELGLLPAPPPAHPPTTVNLGDTISTLSLTVQAPVVVTTTSPLPDAQVGTPYFVTLSATGGSGDGEFTWSLAPGSALPPGLNLSPTGLLYGTPTTVGQTTFSVQAADVKTPNYPSQPQSFTLTVNPPQLQITTYDIPGGTAGQAYSATLTATGGVPPYTWTCTGLPSWLSCNQQNGSLTATLTASSPPVGTVAFKVTVTDSAPTTPVDLRQSVTQPFTLTISPAGTITVDVSKVPTTATVGVPYSGTVTASGCVTACNFALSSDAGSSNDGLSINSSGEITGTPTAPGDFHFTVTVTDSAGDQASATFVLSIAAATPLNVTTQSLPDALAGSCYSSCGSSPVTLDLASSVAVSGNTSTLSGIQTGDTVGLTLNSSGQVSAIDDTSSPTESITGTVYSVSTSSISLTNYTVSLTAAGGTPPYTWTATSCSVNSTLGNTLGTCSGNLPAGLSLNATTGALAGTPTAPGSYSLEFTVTDNAGATATADLTLTVKAAGLTITTTQVPDAAVGDKYSYQLSASGGVQPYTWSLVPCNSSTTNSATGTCFSDTGLIVNNNGLIEGTPSPGTDSTTPYPFVVQVQDAQGNTAQAQLNITINPPLTITTTSLPEGSAGTAYSQTVASSGGVGPYTWTVTCSGGSGNGCLPPGLSLTSNGANATISGTPTLGDGGTTTFTVTVTDSENGTASATLSINVLAVTTASLPSVTTGSKYSETLSAVGGTTPYTWSCSGQPSWLSCSSNGTLSGTAPSSTGSTTFTVTVTDKTGVSSSRSLTVDVT